MLILPRRLTCRSPPSPPAKAVPVAEACAPAIVAGAYFLDFNSASLGAKTRAAALVERADGQYVEGAVLTSVPPCRQRVPILLGGPHAQTLQPLRNQIGFATKVASEQLGVASAVKMCRSIIIKGLEAIVIESFTTARAYSVEDAVIALLFETLPGVDWEKQGTYFFSASSSMAAAARRKFAKWRIRCVKPEWNLGRPQERQSAIPGLPT